MGKGNHVLTFPVNHGQVMNVVAFHTTDEPWKDSSKLTAPATREDALKDFSGFGDTVTKLLSLAKPELEIVSLFYTTELTTGSNAHSGRYLTWETIRHRNLPTEKYVWSVTLRMPLRRIMGPVQDFASRMQQFWRRCCRMRVWLQRSRLRRH